MSDSEFAIFERDVEKNEKDIDMIVCEMLQDNSSDKEKCIRTLSGKLKSLLQMFHV